MKYSNEAKVGIAIVLAAVVFYVGIRYFEDVPLFRGTYELHTTFSNANGLTAGSAVRINGVSVGSVEELTLDTEQDQVRVRFRIDNNVSVPEGSYTQTTGFSAIGAITLRIRLGPSSNPPIEPGGMVPSREEDMLGNLTDRAPEIVAQLDTVLASANTTLGGASKLLNRPDSDLRQLFVALRESAESLDQLLRTERDRISAVLDSVAHLTGNVNQFTEDNADSLSQTVDNLNQVLHRLDRNLASLESSTSRLDAIVAKIDEGEGTLGLLINDPSLYHRLDSTATRLNAILTDFQRDPQRYLRGLKLVEIF